MIDDKEKEKIDKLFKLLPDELQEDYERLQEHKNKFQNSILDEAERLGLSPMALHITLTELVDRMERQAPELKMAKEMTKKLIKKENKEKEEKDENE